MKPNVTVLKEQLYEYVFVVTWFCDTLKIIFPRNFSILIYNNTIISIRLIPQGFALCSLSIRQYMIHLREIIVNYNVSFVWSAAKLVQKIWKDNFYRQKWRKFDSNTVIAICNLAIQNILENPNTLTHRAREHLAGGVQWDPTQIQWGWLLIPAGSRKNVKKIYSANIRSFFLKTIKAMIKHFENILTLIYQTF